MVGPIGRAVLALTMVGSSAATGSDDHGLPARQPQRAPKRLALARGVGAEQHDAPGRGLDGLAGKVERHP